MKGNFKWNLESATQVIKEKLGYEIISDKYIKNHSKLLLKDNIGYFYSISLSKILMGRNPRKFCKTNPYSLQNIILLCKINKKPFTLKTTKYDGDENLEFVCDICKETFKTSIDHLKDDTRGCPYCSGRIVGLSNCLATKNPKLSSEWDNEKNYPLTPYDFTPYQNIKVWWKCREDDNHRWISTINNRSNGNGCPFCNASKGEQKVREIMNILNLNFEEQYSFVDLKGIGGNSLRFDFVVFEDREKTKIQGLFEYDGIFHYEKQYEEDGFETLKIHDKFKNDYCIENNIKLIRIPYWEFDKIEEIIWINSKE